MAPPGKHVMSCFIQYAPYHLMYGGRARERTERLVDPWGPADKDAVWYLIAGTAAGQRTFRLDRVVEAEPTGATFARPADFDLAREWTRIVDEMEIRRGGLDATVLIGASHVAILRKQFGRQCEVLGLTGDARVQVRVSAPTPLMIAQTLAGWGDLIEVVEPPSLRAELARLGSELVARYGGGAAPPYGGGAAPPDGADPARDETGRRSVTAEPG